jgi:hypothetical protein
MKAGLRSIPLPAGVVRLREREGWPLLTVETEANGDSKSTNERGWLIGLFVPIQEIFFCLSCSSRSSTKYCFPHRTLFQLICRAGSPVSYCVSLIRLM